MKQKFNIEKFIEDKSLSENELSSGMASNADLLGYYGYQEVLWRSVVDNLKLQLDTKSSEVELEIKDTAEKITEATVKARVAVNPEIKKIKAALLVAKEQEMLYSNAVSAIDNKGKMLISLGAWKRAEFDNTDMHINKRASYSPTPEANRKLNVELGSGN